MSNLVTIGGYEIGNVDGRSSVVAAQSTYNTDPSALNSAALNAAYANAYAAETSPVTYPAISNVRNNPS